MQNITSKDGTTIAYDQFGKGPAVILVDGALGSRSFGSMPKLSPLLAQPTYHEKSNITYAGSLDGFIVTK